MKQLKRDRSIERDNPVNSNVCPVTVLNVKEAAAIKGGFIPLAIAAVPHIIAYYGSAKVAYGVGAAVGAGAYAYVNSG